MKNKNEKIDYIELPAKDLALAKDFFGRVFDWHFTDYGADYVAFENAGLSGGFFLSEKSSTTENGSVLVVFYSQSLERTMEKITRAGGKIIKPIFHFPGGARFHFQDPNGNEFGVWSDK